MSKPSVLGVVKQEVREKQEPEEDGEMDMEQASAEA